MLQECTGARCLNFEARLPPKLRAKLASDEFVSSCELWFTDLDKDSNGTLDLTELMPILDVLYNFGIGE